MDKLKYVFEEDPLGTAGGVKKAESFFGKESFLVLNGDILTNINLSKFISFHRKKKGKGNHCSDGCR